MRANVRPRVFSVLAALCLATPAFAKSGPSVYTPARQAAAYDNGAFDWSNAASHVGYMQPWLALSLTRVHALVPPPSVPRAAQVADGSLCPNGKPLRRWYVDPDVRFKVKCMDTDDAAPDLWYPENDFERHLAQNLDAAGDYAYPPTDTAYCDPAAASNDCGYGAVIGGKRWYFVAYYAFYTASALARLDLGDPLDGRSLMWSGALSSIFLGASGGLPAARRVAMALHAFADDFQRYLAWYPVHLARDGNLHNYLAGSTGFLLGRMADGIAVLNLVRAYDITYAVWNDPELQAALAAVHPGAATDAASLRAEVAEKLLWAAAPKIADGTIWGNATLPHDAMLHLAWVLDGGPRSQALIDWVFGESGGRLPSIFIDSIDRDGGCDEVAPSYCAAWYPSLLDVTELLRLYQDGELALGSAYSMPFPGLGRFDHRASLLFGWARNLETIPGDYVHLGDEGPTDTLGLPPVPTLAELTLAFHRFGRDPQLAAQIYARNGTTTAGLHTAIWDTAPFAVQAEVSAALTSDPRLRAQETSLAGYGFAQLRDLAGAASSAWAYFGRNHFPDGSFGHHAHHDQLDWGLQYAGTDFMPTPGYPSGFGWRYFGWEANTVSHAAVLVDRTMQSRKVWASDLRAYLATPGSPVTSLELESRTAYPGAYEWPAQLASAVLRRRIVKVPLGNGPFFVVELSSTRGGGVHHYSYHGGGPAATLRGTTLTNTGGTYAALDAGRAVAYAEPYDFDAVDAACRTSAACVEANAFLYRGTGFSFLANAAYTNAPPAVTQLQWNQYDWSTGAVLSGVHLRAFVVPLAGINQLALADGRMPNGLAVRYLEIRGANGTAGSALVNVWEPSTGSDQVKSVRLVGSSVGATGAAAALDVTLYDGRVYHVGLDEDGTLARSFGGLAFTGRTAVYAEQPATINRKKTLAKLFAYLAEGSALAYKGAVQMSGQVPAVTGTLSAVTSAETVNRLYTVAPLDPSLVTNRWVDVQAAAPDAYTQWRDATFRVFGVVTDGGGTALDLSDVPLTARYLDPANYAAGFKQLASPGDTFRIALDAWN
jgi:hypothetical protein